MMNDPLLPPPPPSRNSQRTTPQKSRRPGVANSAKILATGLATTATLGLTTGYALASKAQPAQTPTPTGVQPTTALQTPANTSPAGGTTPVAPTPSVSAPSLTTPPVVEIPVPTVAPAQPGKNWGSPGTNQPSSGSR